MWIQDTALGLQEVEYVLQVFSRNWRATTIKLRNIPGGVDAAEKYLYGKFANQRVEVSGYCLSACALLALAGDPVILEKDAVMAIHGTYSREDGSLNRALSLKGLDWLAGRLPTVPRQVLETALTFERKDEQGLVLRAAPDGSHRIAVDLCEKLLSDCRHVTMLQPGDSRLRLAD